MRVEIRSDGAHISGYANVTEKKSRPVITPHGKVIEEIEPRSFERALERAGNIPLTKDHNENKVLAETRAKTLTLYEDNIGLHYDALIADPETIEELRSGKVKGLSFGMYHVQDELEQRANDLPLRKIKALDLDHITLVVNQTPCYSATSVEVRAEQEAEIETRTIEDTMQLTEIKKELDTPFFDNSAYRSRVDAIRKRRMEEDK